MKLPVGISETLRSAADKGQAVETDAQRSAEDVQGGRHPECQWSSGQRGLDWAFASRELGSKAPYKLRRVKAALAFAGLCLRTETLETEKENLFLILVSWPQGEFILLNPPKILEWRIGCGWTHFEKYKKAKHTQDHTQRRTVPLSPHTKCLGKAASYHAETAMRSHMYRLPSPD